jgi:phosphoribosylanthranilate isomerase
MSDDRLQIKICGMTRPEDARAAVRLGVDAVGVVFAESPRRVTAGVARAVAAAARNEARTSGRSIDVFGLFVNERAEVIRQLARDVGFDVVQLHGDEMPGIANDLQGLRLVKAVRVKDHAALHEIERYWSTGWFEAVLLDAYSEKARGGTGKTFDWSVAEEAAKTVRVILAGGLKADNVREAASRVAPAMVDVSSGVESSPGVKDHASMARFINEARAAPR